jgi:hypothetical protein
MASTVQPLEATTDSANSICFTGLEPALGSLGELIGLLKAQGEAQFCLDDSWFESPFQKTSDGVKNNGEKLATLVGQLLGEVGGKALGVPVKDPALVGTWYPINMPDTGEPTGLYMASYKATDGSQVFGLGVYHKWAVPPSQPALQVDVWAMLPLLKVGNGSLKPVLTEQGYPITLGVAAEGLDQKPLISANGFSFDGVKFSAAIDVAAAIAAAQGKATQFPPVDLSIVILELELPGEAEAKDRSLADLANISAQEILNTASALFITALSKVSETAAERAKYLLPVLGLSTIVPEQTTALPILRWDELFKLAFEGKDVASPFREWFRTVSSDPDLLKTWLAGVAGFMMGQTTEVSGDGSRENPFLVPIIDLSETKPPIGVLSFTAATTVDADAQRHLYPGLNFSSAPIVLGQSPAALTVQADLELAEFVLAENDSVKFTGPASLKFDVGIVLGNKEAGQPLVNLDGYRFGSLKAGLELGIGAKPVPSFNLVDIETPDSKYDSIDLLSPGQLASLALNTLVPLLEQQLKKLLGIPESGKIPFASNAAALVGVTAPEVAEGSWPVETLPPPFSATQLLTTIKDPVGALGNYYRQILTSETQVNGKAAFEYILLEMAGLLQDAALGAATVSIDGDGTIASPWMATISLKDKSLPATLTAYTQTADDVTQLVLGLELGPELVLGSTKIIPSVGIQFLTLDLPKPGSDAQFSGLWASDIHARLSLPDGFESGSVGGATVSVSGASVSAGWNRTEGWNWSLFVGQPQIKIDTQTISLGQDLNFSNQDALRNLVTSGAQAFSRLLVGVTGVALLRTQTRAGLALAGVLGLLKDIDKATNFPPGLDWPEIPMLALDGLSDPRPALLGQIEKDFASDDTARAVLSLVAWAINGAATELPAVPGSRDFASPFKLPIGSTGFEALVWYEDSAKAVGLGLGRTDEAAYDSKLNVTVETRLNFVEVSLANGQLQSDGNTPTLSLLTTIESPAGMLIPESEQTGGLGKIVLGFTLGFADGQLDFNPVVTLLDVTLPGEEKQDELTLEDFLKPEFADRLKESFQYLVNQGIQLAIAQVSDRPSFKSAYQLLVNLGLAIKRESDEDPYGINPAGWQALLADPLVYARQQLNALLTDAALRSSLYAYLQDLLGIHLPPIPTAALDVLSALGFLGDAEQGYPILPDQLLKLAQHPFQTLSDAFSRLVKDSDARQALISKLVKEAKALKTETLDAEDEPANGNIKPKTFGPFTFASLGGTKVSLSIKPENAVKIGSFVSLSGEITFNLDDMTLGSTLSVYNPVLGLALAPSLSFQVKTPVAPPDFTLDIVWGDGTRPAPEALRIYPFNSQTFLNQLADLAPAYALSSLATMVIESNVLSKYPLAQQIFEGLGLAEEVDGRWTMPSLLGLLRDPKGWLLAEGILGDENGKFDLASFGAILKKLPKVTASNGLAVTPTTDGAKFTGLPYNFEIDLSVTTDPAQQATISLATKNLQIASGKGTLENLAVGVSLGPDYQPGITGSLKLSSAAATQNPFFIEAGYDKSFMLTIGQENESDNGDGIAFQILPFEGWGSLVDKLKRAAPVMVLDNLVPVLLEKLKKTGAADFAERLSVAGSSLQVSSLVKALSNVDPFTAENIEKVALDWLRARLSEENAENTAKAIANLLQGVLPTQIAASNGLITYTPSKSLPLTLMVGVNTLNEQRLAGVWAELQLPEKSLLKASVKQTGVGVPLEGEIKPVFSFGVDLTVPIDGNTGPQLSMDFDQAKGFELAFDPLGDSTDSTKHSSLRRDLLPFFPPQDEDDKSTLKSRVEDWLLQVLKDVLPRYVSVVVLNEEKVHQWLEAPILSSEGAPTPATILLATSLLKKADSQPDEDGDEPAEDDNEPTEDEPTPEADEFDEAEDEEETPLPTRYYLNDLDVLKKLDIQTFLGNFLRTLLQTPLKLLSFGAQKQGELWMGPNPDDKNSFGMRIVAPDFPVPGVQNVVLQLGAANTDWYSKWEAIGQQEAGISVYVPLDPQNFKPDFSNLQLNLINVGLDFKGKNDQPLVNLTRFKLGAVAPRGIVLLKMNNGSPSVRFGADVALEEIGISLAPNTLTPGQSSPQSNPIAKNLLGSGDETTKEPKDNPPANPTFTVEAAYTDKLWVNLESDSSSGSQVIIPVQRSFGPLYAKSVGIGWQQSDYLLQILFAGSVALAGLRAEVDQLTVGIPVKTITDFSKYSLDLQGLNVTFQGGAVSISGGFLKTTDPYLSYTGAALVKAASFSLVAIGSYAEYPVSNEENAKKVPSLFVFGALNAPLGGPPAFFITGVAAGFSYNRNIQLPDVGDVQNFPLVSGVVNGTFSSGQSPDSALATLAKIVNPEVGQYWLAAGLKFTSFQLLDCFALLFLKFGRDWEITLLGLASAPLPKGLPQGSALAYIELGLKVSIKITEGIVSVEAQLTPNSYIIAKDCKLTGGFAFYLWFKDIKTDKYTIPAGSFVVTLGGYHPSFKKPEYFPDVPRLGFTWLIDAGVGNVSISGGAYFALTPTAVMAGGYLRVLFEAGPLRAWLDAAANFLVEWKPFYYNVEIKVSVGVAFQTKILGVSITLKVELGADLQLEGPPTHGKAHVSWYIISFTIPFGESKTLTNDNTLDWGAFEKSFLPQPSDKQQPPAPAPMFASMDNVSDTSGGAVQQIVKLRAEDGLLKDNQATGWLINPFPFILRVDSTIPTTELVITSSDTTLSGPSVGVRPMGMTASLNAPLTVTIQGPSGQPVNLKQRNIQINGSFNGAPAALWSKQALDRDHAPDPNSMMISGALMGASLQANQYVSFGSIQSFPVENLKYDPGDTILLPFARTPQYPPSPRYSADEQKVALSRLKTTIMETGVVSKRNQLLKALQASEINAPLDPSLSVTASSADLVMQAPPVLARLGVYQTGTVQAGRVASFADAEPEAPKALPPRQPELLGIARRYQISNAPTEPLYSGLLPHSNMASGRWIDSKRTAVKRQAMRSFAEGDEPKSSLQEGTLALWRVDPRVRYEISPDGNLPLRLVCFDEFGELLSDSVSAEQTSMDLPLSAAEVAMQGVSLASTQRAVGWQLDTSLIRVNYYYGVGENCTIRTQNVRRLRHKGRYIARGIVSAEEMLRSNQVETTMGSLKQGWVETTLPGGRKCFVVMVSSRGEAAASDLLRVTAIQGERPGLVSQEELKPAAEFTSGETRVLIYRAPEAEDKSYLTVIAQPVDAGTDLLGVYAIEMEPEEIEPAWIGLALDQSAASFDQAEEEEQQPRSTIARIISK